MRIHRLPPAALLLLATLPSACAPPPRLVLREATAPAPYMQFSIIVPRGSGSLRPAQAEADALCAEVLQSALMFMAAEVGDDRTRYHFRCR
ncbi:MAG: hypothetical protein HKM95_04355 [Inquilinus sp.]|nr:hypothetical protein [Inquilinus sp.]